MTKVKGESPSVAGLLVIYALLLGLLALTLAMAALPLGALGLMIALAIASTKAILVILYFMHLRFSSRVTWLFAGAGFVWLAILFSLTFTEYIGRSYLSRMQSLDAMQTREVSPDRIRAHIEHVVPGFTQYNTRVRQPGGFYLPDGPHEGKFNTPTAKAKFIEHAIPHRDLAPGQLLLTTIRSHGQFNTTIYSENDRYRGVFQGRRVVLLNDQDMQRQGLEKNQWVDLISHFEGETRRARRFKVIPYEIPAGCAAAYFPETNVLVPIRSVAVKSNQPVSKSIVIIIEPAKPLD